MSSSRFGAAAAASSGTLPAAPLDGQLEERFAALFAQLSVIQQDISELKQRQAAGPPLPQVQVDPLDQLDRV